MPDLPPGTVLPRVRMNPRVPKVAPDPVHVVTPATTPTPSTTAINTEITTASRPSPEALASLDEAISAFVAANTEKNAASRREEAAKKRIEKLMADADIRRHALPIGDKTYEATIEPGERNYVDVAILRTLVDDATFMKIVSATQGDVKEHCGTATLARVLKTKTTPPSLKIKAV
jgi:hypothetical protein